MPDLKSVLAAYEKTIVANEQAGVSSKMYLSNIAKNPKSKISMTARTKPTGSSSSSHHRRTTPPVTRTHSSRLGRLENVPEKGTPTDMTVTTTTTASTSTLSTSAFDPFADDKSIDLDDGFEVCSTNDAFHNSFTSFTSANENVRQSLNQRLRPSLSRGSASSSSVTMTRTPSQRSLNVRGDEGSSRTSRASLSRQSSRSHISVAPEEEESTSHSRPRRSSRESSSSSGGGGEPSSRSRRSSVVGTSDTSSRRRASVVGSADLSIRQRRSSVAGNGPTRSSTSSRDGSEPSEASSRSRRSSRGDGGHERSHRSKSRSRSHRSKSSDGESTFENIMNKSRSFDWDGE